MPRTRRSAHDPQSLSLWLWLRLRLPLLVFLCVCLALVTVRVEGETPAPNNDRRAFFPSATGVESPKHVQDPIVQEAAQFAVTALSKLSDSGIYTTLRLAKILEASAQVGSFHYMINLRVALASPHFKSGNATEVFEMMVLESKPPGASKRASLEGEPLARSIAIDEFPEMDEDAIEEYWIQMVETRRAQRRELFRQWTEEAADVDAVADDHDSRQRAAPSKRVISSIRPKTEKPTTQRPKKTLTLEDLQTMSTKALRKMLGRASLSEELRFAITSILDERWDQLEKHEAMREVDVEVS